MEIPKIFPVNVIQTFLLMLPRWWGTTSFSLKTSRIFIMFSALHWWPHVVANIPLFHRRSVWVRTTRSTYWNQLTEARGGEYFPGLSSPVDAVFDIPAKGAVYIFTGTGSGKSSSVKASSAWHSWIKRRTQSCTQITALCNLSVALPAWTLAVLCGVLLFFTASQNDAVTGLCFLQVISTGWLNSLRRRTVASAPSTSTASPPESGRSMLPCTSVNVEKPCSSRERFITGIVSYNNQ